jgi:hypothetical protein
VATSQSGQSLRQVARALEKIPDEAVKEAAEHTVARAQQIGGRFGQKRVKLGAKVKPSGKGSVLVLGVTAGGWAIRSYGRSESKAKPGSVLGVPGDGFHSTKAKAVRTGNRSWDKVREFAEDESPRVVVEAVRKALR